MTKSVDEARKVLRIEADGILNLIERVDERFDQLVELIGQSTGRLIIGGIGKSGIVGRKIVATLNSTGTRSLFMHPVEAMHGDLGMVGRDDVFLALSNSGETDELNLLLASLRRIGCKIVAFTGNSQSTLAANSDIVIDVGVAKEACPLGLAPTASTTAQLAMGDALAVALINRSRFNSRDFRKNHPGGALGQRLQSKVQDLMLTGGQLPMVPVQTPILEALQVMDDAGLGVLIIVDGGDVLQGIVTDGDLRRLLAKDIPVTTMSLAEVMTARPHVLKADVPSYDALNLMEAHEITVLPILDDDGRVEGLLHLHDILGKGALKFNGQPGIGSKGR